MKRFFLFLSFIFLFSVAFNSVNAQEVSTIPFPKIDINVGTAQKPDEVSTTLQLLLLLTVLSLAPSILIMTTSYLRIIIVFQFLKNALGTMQMPPNQLLAGIAMFLTFFIMSPTFNQINNNALKPYMDGKMTLDSAYQKGVQPIRTFMFKNTRDKDIELFLSFSQAKRPETRADLATHILIPAFILSELRAAFIIGFFLFIPFLVIDMIVASVLMSMGMMMLPPMLISLPFKILLFVLVDGWNLIVGSLVRSFS